MAVEPLSHLIQEVKKLHIQNASKHFVESLQKAFLNYHDHVVGEQSKEVVQQLLLGIVKIESIDLFGKNLFGADFRGQDNPFPEAKSQAVEEIKKAFNDLKHALQTLDVPEPKRIAIVIDAVQEAQKEPFDNPLLLKVTLPTTSRQP